MDPTKKKLSGHAYRRKVLERKHKEVNFVKQIYEIDSFFLSINRIIRAPTFKMRH